MTDFDLDLEQVRAARAMTRDQGVMPRAARLAERMAYCDLPLDSEHWRQVRREIAEIFKRLG